MSHKRTRKIITRIVVVLAGLIALAAIAIGIILHTVVTPEKVTPIVLNLANEYLKAKVNCKSVDVAFFSTFPNLGIRLEDGSILTLPPVSEDSLSQICSAQDSLLAFRSCVVSFDPVSFLLKKEIIIHKLSLDHPVIYASVDSMGNANWNIFPENNDTTQSEQFQPQLNLKGISISNAHITYDDLQQDLWVQVDSLDLKLTGNMQKESARLDLKVQTRGLTSSYEGQSFSHRLPIKINAKLRSDQTNRRLAIEEALFTVGVLGLDVKGSIQQKETNQPAEADLDFKLDASSLGELVALIPQQMTDVGGRIVTTGKVNSSGKLSGQLGKGAYPLLTLSMQLEEGSLRSSKQSRNSGLKKIDAVCDARIDFSGLSPSFINIDSLYLESFSSSVGFSGRVEDIFRKPYLSIAAKGNIDVARLSEDLIFGEEMKTGGTVKLNLSGKCFLDDLLNADYGKLNANGNIDVSKVIFDYPREGISVYAPSASIRLGSNVTDSVRGRIRESLLRGNIELDSLNIRWKDKLLSDIGKLSVRIGTEAPKDTGTISVVTTSARLENMTLSMGDSIRVRAVRAGTFLKLGPQEENPSKVQLTARITVDSLRGRMPIMGGRINDGRLRLTIKKQEPRTTRNRRSMATELRPGRDSVSYASLQDSSRRINRQVSNREGDLSFRLESQEAKDVLRNWDVSGTLESKSMGLRTPYFPLPIRMTESSLKFTTNTLSLSGIQLKVGTSEMTLSGEIEGIRRALLRNGKISAKLNLDARTIDFNEIIKAAVTGSEFAEKNSLQRDSISQNFLGDEKGSVLVLTDTVSNGVFVIPGNIDVEFNAHMNNALYGNLKLNNVSGKIIIRDQAVHLSDMKLDSDLGSAQMSLAYKAPDTRGAHLGIDLGLTKMDVKELIGAFPMIDSLTPMLRSFEGVVDCKMTMVTELDSLMNIRLPETTATYWMHGENMVLLDGETFSEISKMLMFKNKKRNMIDSISVDMVLESNKIMIFPFHVSIDRYQAGVGGTQNLDMTFNYHITVLKSPLPFKLGLNISGSPDNMKIRLAKAKYKDLFTPAEEKDLTSATINARQQMDQKLKKSIEDIINQPATASIRKPETDLPENLKETFFKLDTTKVDYPQATPVDSVAQ